MNNKFKVAGIGEVLWDKLPQGDVLGGAPANVAFHALKLGAESYLISAVGNDEPGNEIIFRLSEKGIRLLINRAVNPTGTVNVTLDEEGVPEFVIAENVAWDNIKLTTEATALAGQLDAVCFGTLAQRNSVSQNSITKFLNLLPEDALIIFDINLRQNFYNKKIINESLTTSNILKINDEELIVFARLFGMKGGEESLCRKILEEFDLKLIAYTCGTKGSYLFSKDETSFIQTPAVIVEDTIGAGDSFTAALMVSMLNGYKLVDCHSLAVEISAFVCQNKGAMPEYTNRILSRISSE